MPQDPVELEDKTKEKKTGSINAEAKDVSGEMTKNSLATAANNVWWGIKKGVLEVGMAVGQMVPDFFKKQYEGSLLQKGVAGIKYGIGASAQAVANGVGWVGRKVRDGALKLFPPEGKFVGFFKKLGSSIVSASKKVGLAFAKLGAKITNGIQKVAGKIKTAYEGSRLQKAVKAVGKALAPIGKGVMTAVGVVAYGIGKVGEGIGKVADKAVDTFGGVSFETNDIMEEIYERNRQALDPTYNERVEEFRTRQAIHDINPNELKGEREQVLDALRDAQDSNSVSYLEGDEEKTVDVFDNISYLSDTNRLKEQLNNEKGFGEGSHELRDLNAEGKDIDLDVKHEGFTQRIDETNSRDIIRQKNEAEGKEEAPPVEIEYAEQSNTMSTAEAITYDHDSLLFMAAANIISNTKAEKKLDSFQENEGKEIKEKAVDKHYGKMLFESATARKQVISQEKMNNINLLVIAGLCKATQSMTGLNVDQLGAAAAGVVNAVTSYVREMGNDKKVVINNIFGGDQGFKRAQEKYKLNGDELLHEVVRGSNCATLSQVADRVRLEQALQIASNYNKGYAHGSEKLVAKAGLVNKDGTLDVEKMYKLLGGSLRIKDALATRTVGEQGRTNKSSSQELEKRTQIRNKAINTVQKKVSGRQMGM